MSLAGFIPKASGNFIESDSFGFKGDENYGVAVLVKVRKFMEQHVSKKNPERGARDKVVVDIMRVSDGAMFIGVVWGSGSLVDNLKGFAGVDQVVPLTTIKGASNKGSFPIAAPLEGDALAQATARYNSNPKALDDERARREEAVAQDSGEVPAPTVAPLATTPAPTNTPMSTTPPPAVDLGNVTPEQLAAAMALIQQGK